MQKVLTSAEMKDVDRQTAERYSLPTLLLMENAAHAVVRVVLEKFGGSVAGLRALAICGKGNNGGDGAAIARILADFGCDVTLRLLGAVSETAGDARINFKAANALPSIKFTENYDGELSDLSEFDLLIDAIFGTGLSRPPSGSAAKAIRSLAAAAESDDRPMIVAVDIPSGIRSDEPDSFEPGSTVNADVTVCFTSPKPANVLPPAVRANGELFTAGIGSPQTLIDEQPSQLFLADAGDAADFLRSVAFFEGSYKNKRGHCTVAAGSRQYTGAAVLASNAAMRSGVGLVTLAVPAGAFAPIAERLLPEVMIREIDDGGRGAFAASSAAQLIELFADCDAGAIGCGIGRDAETAEVVRTIVSSGDRPLVIDADALTLLSPLTDGQLKARRGLIVTPHDGEFRRLTGLGEIIDRVAAVRTFSVDQRIITVLKGERVLIASPDGRVVINPTGNAGLGKAGNGDTLTGIIASFAAQAAAFEIDLFRAVTAAVFIAGAAGDIAAERFGMHVMTASDVRECLADAFKMIGGDGL